MTESEFDRLHQFGQHVQLKSNNKKKIEKKVICTNILKKYTKDIINNDKKYLIIIINIALLLKEKIRLFFHMFHQKNHFKIDSPVLKNHRENQKNKTVIVEHQKQLRNTSFIIRQRKKIQSNNTRFPVHHTSVFSYYFHRIDLKENETKSRFSPKQSLWDFKYSSKNNLFSKIKDLFLLLFF